MTEKKKRRLQLQIDALDERLVKLEEECKWQFGRFGSILNDHKGKLRHLLYWKKSKVKQK